jgi:hypothetical protein
MMLEVSSLLVSFVVCCTIHLVTYGACASLMWNLGHFTQFPITEVGPSVLTTTPICSSVSSQIYSHLCTCE